MNIGFFCFDNQEEYEKKQAMFEKTECTEIYAGGDGKSFSELADTVLNSGDTVYLPSLKDLGNTFTELINAFEYVEENKIKLVLLEGIQNEMLFGTTKGTAARAVNAFTRLLVNEQIC